MFRESFFLFIYFFKWRLWHPTWNILCKILPRAHKKKRTKRFVCHLHRSGSPDPRQEVMGTEWRHLEEFMNASGTLFLTDVYLVAAVSSPAASPAGTGASHAAADNTAPRVLRRSFYVARESSVILDLFRLLKAIRQRSLTAPNGATYIVCSAAECEGSGRIRLTRQHLRAEIRLDHKERGPEETLSKNPIGWNQSFKNDL